MSKIAKVGVVILNLVAVAILVAAIMCEELRISGIACVVIACILWEITRE